MKTTLILEIDHKKLIPDLIDKVAGRAYTIDGVENVEAVRGDISAHVDSMQRLLIGESE